MSVGPDEVSVTPKKSGMPKKELEFTLKESVEPAEAPLPLTATAEASPPSHAIMTLSGSRAKSLC